MKTSTSLLALAVLSTCALHAQEAWLPLEPGKVLTYRVAGTDVRVEVGGTFQLDVHLPGEDRDRSIEVRQLVGLSEDAAYVAATDAGALLVMVRPFGDGGDPTPLPVADLRWVDESWEFWTADGCEVWKVECRRAGIERVEVPAGAWDCLRLEIGDEQTFWLARGVGIVRWRDRTDGIEVVRELASVE